MFLTPGLAILVPFVPMALLMGLFIINDSYWRPYGDRGAVYDTVQASNGVLKMKVDAMYETGVYMPGAYHVISAAPDGTESWREIL
jgi:hypothetical protein